MSITEDFRNDPLYDERYAGHTKKTLKNIDDNIDDLRAEKNIAMNEEGMHEDDEFIVNINNKIETLIKSKSI